MIERQPGSRELRTRNSRDSHNTAEAGRVSSDNIRITSLDAEGARGVLTDTMTVTPPWRQPDIGQSAHPERPKEHSEAEWVTECWRKEMPG